MKRLVLCIFVLAMTLTLYAQSSFSVGARGGFDFLVPESKQASHAKFGVAGALDVGYTHYWFIGGFGDMGLHTGLSAGYATNETRVDWEQQYTNVDYLNNEMLYTANGNTTLTMYRAYAEIPVMAALRTKNIIAQLGLKAQYSFWSDVTHKVNEVNIDAYYVPYDVHVTNELITGKLAPENLTTKTLSNAAPNFNLLVAMRVGYEFRIRKKDIIGVAAYLDCNVWNTKSAPQEDPHIAVSSIDNSGPIPVPAITVNHAYNTVTSRIFPIQVGVSVYYALEFRIRGSFKIDKYE